MQNGSILNSLLNLNTAPATPARGNTVDAGAQVDFQRLVEESRAELNRAKESARDAAAKAGRAALRNNDNTRTQNSSQANSGAAGGQTSEKTQTPANADSQRADSTAAESQPLRHEGNQEAVKTAQKTTGEEKPGDESKPYSQSPLEEEQPAVVVSPGALVIDSPINTDDAGALASGDKKVNDDQPQVAESSAALPGLVDGSGLVQPAIINTEAADELNSSPLAAHLPGLTPNPLAKAVAGANQSALADDQGESLIDVSVAAADTDSPSAVKMQGFTELKAQLGAAKNLGDQLASASQGNIQAGADDKANQNSLLQTDSSQSQQLDADALADFKGLLNASRHNVQTLAKAGEVADAVKPSSPTTTAAAVVDSLARPLDAMSPAARSFAVQTSVPQSVGHAGWSQAVGDRVLWMAAQNLSAADIRLDPPDLGTMHVKVVVHDNQASVSFVSPHPIVREALDQQSARLREMFSEQGLNLVNVDVSDRHQNANDQEQRQGKSQGGSVAEDEVPVAVVATSLANLRLVDHYA